MDEKIIADAWNKVKDKADPDYANVDGAFRGNLHEAAKQVDADGTSGIEGLQKFEAEYKKRLPKK